ncbi:unnamed protein product [Brassica oleracea var. botrytis]|nr:unnamed protein product [Brassica napus]CDY69654.1 BnaCnng64650D [Brassica napus]
MNEDRISELPEALLLHILSYVPTKDVIATSVLSKRWRSLWKMVPKLEFEFDMEHVSSEAVYRKLHLYYVEFKDEESVCNLFSGCPRLQDLVVKRYSNANVETYSIAVPSLQRLTIEEDCSTDVNDGGYVINAPSLKYLSIECLGFIDFCLIENAPELVEANIKNVSHIANENIIASLTSPKCLSFHLPLEIKCPTGSIFYQLVSLELHINEINGWNLLSFMLDSSPKLQILKLFGSYRYRERSPVSWEWTQPKCVPKCLLLHLETLVWTRYGWQREDEKQVATYILKNAKQLKKATFYPTCVGAETAGKVGKEARDAQRVG